ncbi:hypothetical protein DMN91_005126 [Ooceraea biroi]|uniref:Uncharacterized protein n=1 Tax=Ooceraea biroi TaxID=2015173 RepID=A0A3L8DSV3_OOCBI|nr:hypothetical protein DMN91_005126 [Ooceraea biroi]
MIKKGFNSNKNVNIRKKNKKGMPENKNNMKRNEESEVIIRTGVPTYTELVEYVQEKQRLRHKESMQNMEVEAVEDINDTNCIEEVDCITTETMQHMELENDTTNIETNKRVDNHTNVSIQNASMKTLVM